MKYRLELLCEKIDNCLRDDTSGLAVFDMFPAWLEEYRDRFNVEPGTSGGTTSLDHYMRAAEYYDDELPYSDGFGIARIGRCLYEWDSAGFYSAKLLPSVAEAKAIFSEQVQREIDAQDAAFEELHQHGE